MNKLIAKVPIWAYTLVLVVVSSVAAIFSGVAASSSLLSGLDTSLLSNALELSPVALAVFYVIVIGAVNGGVAHLLVRIVYSIGDRIFFRTMRAVPDYNLRRLPITYGQLLRGTFFWLIVAKLIEALFATLLTYVCPVAYYLWRFVSALATFGCLVAAYFMLDRAYVPAWQSGKCFFALAIPTGIVFALWLVLGGAV